MNNLLRDASSYVRTSERDQNCDTQSLAISDFCVRAGYRITKEYRDSGFSGKDDKRPQFECLLNDIRAGKVKCIIVYKLDRIGRSLKHLLSLFEELKKRGVEFISTTQNIDTSTPEGKMFWQMLGVFAEYERELIVARTLAGLERARRQGKQLGRPMGARDKKERKKSGYLLRYIEKKKTRH